MNSFLEFINRVPLLIESILVVLVPSSKQVYANTYANEEASDDELLVASLTDDTSVKTDSVFVDNGNTKYVLTSAAHESATANFVQAQSSMQKEIQEYEEEQERIRQEEEANKSRAVGSSYSYNLSEVAGGDAWSIANSLVGMPGDCFYICQLFIQAYTGQWRSFGDIYQTDSPEPGDLIYYADGGTGYQHWAIYLGGDQSLQGNYNGTTVIRSLYISSASSPVFYKLP